METPREKKRHLCCSADASGPHVHDCDNYRHPEGWIFPWPIPISTYDSDGPRTFKPGDSITFQHGGVTLRVTATDKEGVDSGRRRFKTECVTCEKLLHPATTGPSNHIEMHLVDETKDRTLGGDKVHGMKSPLHRERFVCVGCWTIIEGPLVLDGGQEGLDTFVAKHPGSYPADGCAGAGMWLSVRRPDPTTRHPSELLLPIDCGNCSEADGKLILEEGCPVHDREIEPPEEPDEDEDDIKDLRGALIDAIDIECMVRPDMSDDDLDRVILQSIANMRAHLAEWMHANENLTRQNAEMRKTLIAETSKAPVDPTAVMRQIIGPPARRRLPDERQSVVHHFVIHATERDEKDQPVAVDHDVYLTVGFYPDGEVGEIFVKMHRQGSTASGYSDAWAMGISYLLQVGVPLAELAKKYKGARFEPSGRTETPGIRTALSPIDYIARYLERRYVEKKTLSDED